MQFTDFSLHERLHRAVVTAGFTTPTPIQEAALPLALAGHDIVGTAQTGTGKTAAFVLPILQRLMDAPASTRKTRALILTPTRELAEQIHTTIQQLGAHTSIRSATIYGGVGMMPQERALRNGIEIIVACPGRLLDHIARGNTDFSQVNCLVLDEADRMLDMGFLPPITRIIGMLPHERQTMLFSATFATELNGFVKKTLQNPQRVEMGIAAPAETVAHTLYPVPKHLKTALLTTVLRSTDTKSVLIFTRTKHRANRIAEQLERAGFSTGVLHANKSQNHRQLTLDQFRAGKLQMLVATDIAARGIDVQSISHVINYDIPDCADAYIHRIGRTGRAEHNGEALTFVTPEDYTLVRDIERTLGERIATCIVEDFNYKQAAPKADEFHRDPLPPRRSFAPARNSEAPRTSPAKPASISNDRKRANMTAPPKPRTYSDPQNAPTGPGKAHGGRKADNPFARSRGRAR